MSRKMKDLLQLPQFNVTATGQVRLFSDFVRGQIQLFALK
jgi:hypothetical protein